MKYEETYIYNYNEVYIFAVIKHKLFSKSNEPSLSDYKFYVIYLKKMIGLKKSITNRENLTVPQVLNLIKLMILIIQVR